MLKIAADKALVQLRAGKGGKLDRRTGAVDDESDGNKDPAIREGLSAEEPRRQQLIIELEWLSSADGLSDLNEARPNAISKRVLRIRRPC